MRNGGGGFAANIYGVMFEGGSQVTSPQSLVPSHKSQVTSYQSPVTYYFYISSFQTISFHDIIRITHFIGRSEVGRGS